MLFLYSRVLGKLLFLPKKDSCAPCKKRMLCISSTECYHSCTNDDVGCACFINGNSVSSSIDNYNCLSLILSSIMLINLCMIISGIRYSACYYY